MRHYPIFVALAGRRVIISGGGEAALAKLRLLLKTEARITVFAFSPVQALETYASANQITLIRRDMAPGDALCAVLFYAADEDKERDAYTAAIARADGALTNIVDNLDDSQFITPAIVDRDPVTVAIGTEGAAPVLARAIKADLEEHLPISLGRLARIGKAFRKMADTLPKGRARRDFWRDYYFRAGPRLVDVSKATVSDVLNRLLIDHQSRSARSGHVAFVGAGPGDPELLTLKARKALDEADVVIYDRLVGAGVLELARREALMINAGKEGFGPSMSQEQITDLIVQHAKTGAQVVRLKGGDATVFGRLDEETAAVTTAGISWHVVPGITAASAAAAAIGQSLTRRGRNDTLQFLTGHDMAGFADHDWRALTGAGEVAAIYMGKRAARFIQGRLLMHGASPDTPVSVVENASRADQRILACRLGDLPDRLIAAGLNGPAVMLLGLAPHAAEGAIPALPAISQPNLEAAQ